MKQRLTAIFLCLFFACLKYGFAQSADADFMRSIGKMYVVVAVLVAIFIGIIAFLLLLEKKLTKLENQINNNE